jgi:hypothetical protein
MPKEGLSDEDWERRLQVYTKVSKAMKQGMAPRKDNRRIYAKYMAIATCPKQEKSASQRSVYGGAIHCKCGYHNKIVSR